MHFNPANRVEVGGVSDIVIDVIGLMIFAFILGMVAGQMLFEYLIRKGWSIYQRKP